jgi:hypothetical protein
MGESRRQRVEFAKGQSLALEKGEYSPRRRQATKWSWVDRQPKPREGGRLTVIREGFEEAILRVSPCHWYRFSGSRT